MPLSAEHIDLTTLGGWLGLLTVGMAWVFRALAVHRRLVSLEATVLQRLTHIEERQDRMSVEMSRELRDLRARMDKRFDNHIDRHSTRQIDD